MKNSRRHNRPKSVYYYSYWSQRQQNSTWRAKYMVLIMQRPILYLGESVIWCKRDWRSILRVSLMIAGPRSHICPNKLRGEVWQDWHEAKVSIIKNRWEYNTRIGRWTEFLIMTCAIINIRDPQWGIMGDSDGDSSLCMQSCQWTLSQKHRRPAESLDLLASHTPGISDSVQLLLDSWEPLTDQHQDSWNATWEHITSKSNACAWVHGIQSQNSDINN